MESSEDDAGTATSASCRASAREKDVGLAEDVDAARNFQHESSETRASCGTPAMSEDNFDGDSVPSPSSKETSTEAILDMIDDFIGDPRAPRLPPQAAVDRVSTPSVPSTSNSQYNKQFKETREQITAPPREPILAPVANVEILSESVHVQPAEPECTPQSEILICVNASTSEASPPASSSAQVDEVVDESGSTQQPEISQNVIPVVSIEEPNIAPPSSSVESAQVILDNSECDILERTVKCVTSSENRDSVTVELAESTSSECNVSESKALSMEPTMSRSPLKRRLIRPAPSDRRPDSTVSSTVDSHVDIHTNEQTSDTVAKDVSSSSDAVPLHGVTKPEEISNVSEISICKAETSTVHSRKIKLVRPKGSPVSSNSVRSETQTTSGIVERDRCQSTSSDEISIPSSAEVATSSVNTAKTEEHENRPLPVISTVEQQHAQISQLTQDFISNSEAVITNNTVEKETQCTETPQVIEPSINQVPNTLPENLSPASGASLGDTHMKDMEKQTRSSILKAEKKVPPITLNLAVSETATDVTKAQCSSTNLEQPQEACDGKSPSLPLVDQDVVQTPSRNCDQDKQIIKDFHDCDVSKSEKKVPPMKINLTNEDHSKNSELPRAGCHKVEESTKQVPKLTIKLTNKYTEESKSPVPKLTIKPLRPVEQNPDDCSTQQVPNVTKLNIKPIPIPTEKVIESVSTPVQQPAEKSSDDCDKNEQILNVTKIHIKPIPKSTETANESLPTPIQSTMEQDTDTMNKTKQVPTITKINIKPILKPVETVNESILQPPQPISVENTVDSDSSKQTPNVVKLYIKPITIPADMVNESVLPSLQSAEQGPGDAESSKQIQSVTKVNVKPFPKPTEKLNEIISKPLHPALEQNTDDSDSTNQFSNVTKINIRPIPKPTEKVIEGVAKALQPTLGQDIEDWQIPNVTKLNIKPIPKPTEYGNEGVSKSLQSHTDQKSEGENSKQQIPSITKINIKPIIKPPEKENESILKTQDSKQNVEEQHIPSVTKINIKSIPKPSKNFNDSISRPHPESVQNEITSKNEQIPVITKLNIKPLVKPAEKIHEVHRKSSSSEISESECSENDETTSTSDQASASDQGPLISVPKLTIKLGKPGTESEGKFYTEKNIPKLTIKNIQQSDKDDKDSKMKLIVSQSDDKQDKVPKLTIKTFITKSDSQPLSPKLTIKPLKPPESISKDNEIPKLKISTESISSSAVVKENVHVPKITIKPVTKLDGDGTAKTPKKSTMMFDSSDHIPVVTKLNIKPVLKPTESGDSSESYDEKVPVVSKLNIKPVIKPKDNEVDSSIEEVPKITKLNIKPIKNPEESSSDKKDCDEKNAEMKDSCIPVVTKLNIKPIVKPVEDEALKDSENQSSETGNSSDENADHIPVVTKLNIKPIVKPCESEEPTKPAHSEQCIPVVTKLNIKPLVKPEELSPGSPKKESLKSSGSTGIPVLTKLNIKPVVKPDDLHNKPQEENIEKSSKPPLLMKINMKNVSEMAENEHLCNNVAGKAHIPKMAHSPKATKRSTMLEKNSELISSKSANSSPIDEVVKNTECSRGSPSLLQTECPSSHSSDTNIVPEMVHKTVLNSSSKEQSKPVTTEDTVPERSIQESQTRSEQLADNKTSKKNAIQMAEANDKNARLAEHFNTNYNKSSILNYTLLKKLLSTTKEVEKNPDTKPSNCISQSEKSEPMLSNCIESKTHEEDQSEIQKRLNPKPEIVNDLKHSSDSVKIRSIEDVHKEANESVTKPLEIITDKLANESSGQDSPRIILKINKTDQGASAKIITEETHKPTNSPTNDTCESEHIAEAVNETSPKKHVNNRRKAAAAELAANMSMGKRLRSSRIVESAEKSPVVKKPVNKRPSAAESPGPLQQKESELSIYETKRMKLEQLLSANKSLTITPVVSKVTQTSPSKSSIAANQGGKVSHNHTLLNNESSQKNGNSKLQNILSNLQAKQMQTLQLNDTSVTEKPAEVAIEGESGTSTGSSDVVVEITRVENSHLEVQEMMINENSVCDLTGPDDVSQDPLEVESTKTPEEPKEPASVQPIEMTPTPRKRGRPRKLPLPENAKPPTPAPLPVPALEERPQRSLRLMREKPAILRKPRGGRGRGRGRGGRCAATPPAASPDPEPKQETEPESDTVVVIEVEEARAPSPIDPTSSRIKLPRMTEALDKSVAGANCATPLSSRRRSSSASAQTDLKLFSSAAVVLESPAKGDEFMKSPETARPRSGRGSRGGRGRTPRNRGRGRGGGRGAMYMKETMGIYGRVCGPATTTVQLFEEETCMMDDNATPSKPSHLLDEDSQSSVKSSTNDSNKMKKSKFADLFDSNKVWTAADVKEYTWPPPDTPNAESQVMMIQEQVAMFLGVKSFKRRYPELKRRPVGGEEREYVLSKGLVSEALCDLGITAVDASEVLDIMLSDYPHKYEEYRSHQRQRQTEEVTVEVKVEDRPTKLEIKSEKTSDKPEPPKVDPEKTRQDMAAAAIASAAEWNARANAWRRPACVDLQSNTIHRRRPAAGPAPPARVRPPAGFYPHALLPGQFQHWYRTYTADQLRYFPLNTALAAPPAPPSPAESSSESEGSWGVRSSSSEDEDAPHHSAKRKKLTRKRSSQQDKEDSNAGGEVDTCRMCKLRLEANRKHTHERFLVCANCNAKLHPACVSLPADTIRKCRSYAWQCAECKSCCACSRHQDDDKMLFCDLCDRGFHIYCVGLTAVPLGRWHCVECAICKSCGARDPNGLNPGTGTPGPPAPGPSTPGPSTPGPSTPGVLAGPGEWHHQTRRGPGGHKVYSHSLCTPCARAYRIGRYCPLCERSFIGPKGTMQLVICKLCDRQLHQECVRQTVSSLRVLDYTCAECRRGGITSRAAAVRAAPRTIATLFMAKRRFNKYAHRQYLASRLQALQDAAEADAEPEPAPTDEETSRDIADPLEGVGDDAAPPDD